MTEKKKDLPAMPFYIGDWKKDPAIQVLTREQKMVWFEMIMLMWESDERGYLTLNKKPYTKTMLAMSLNLDNQILETWLSLFQELGLYSMRESDKAIYCRKIVKMVELSKTRKMIGFKGGNPNLLNQKTKGKITKKNKEGYPNSESESESEYEIEDEYINLFPENFKTNQKFILAWQEWLKYSETINKSVTSSMAKSQLHFLSRETNPIGTIEQTIRNGWKTLVSDKTPIIELPKQMTEEDLDHAFGRTKK